MPASENLSGLRFGSLVAQTATEERTIGGSIVWEFLCDCGKVSRHVGYRVKNGSTSSCGCSRRCKTTQDSGATTQFADYKYKAKKRGIAFLLSKNEFMSLIQAPCVYCGRAPTSRHRKYDFVANGVDRVDNSKGYIVTNCAPCCDICNYAKRDIPQDIFLKWLDDLVEFRLSGRLIVDAESLPEESKES